MGLTHVILELAMLLLTSGAVPTSLLSWPHTGARAGTCLHLPDRDFLAKEASCLHLYLGPTLQGRALSEGLPQLMSQPAMKEADHVLSPGQDLKKMRRCSQTGFSLLILCVFTDSSHLPVWHRKQCLALPGS